MEFHAVLARMSRIWRKSCAGSRSCGSGLGAVPNTCERSTTGVARNRKSKFRLFFTRALDADDGESASV